jgi:tRNA G18 (ribose-2'-O)-methylase SpoU
MKNVSDSVKQFLEVFADDPDGFSEKVYNQLYNLVEVVFGNEGTTVLAKYVDACDGSFYIPEHGYAQFMSEVLALQPAVT